MRSLLLLAVLTASYPYDPPPTRTTDRGCSTATYIDADCDGYGVGAPNGPDADDHDPSINTAASWEAKYSSDLRAFLTTQRGYSLGASAKIYYISTAGNNGTGKPNDATKPYATWAAVKPMLVAGDAVVWRAGTYAETISNAYGVKSGVPGKPLLLMAYPGEAAIISNSVLGFGDAGNYITLDGLRFTGTGTTGHCVSWNGSASGAYGLTIRNVLCEHFYDGFNMMEGFHDVLVEDSVSRDAQQSHTLYFGARSYPATNITIRRNIFYRAPFDGIHVNGRFVNLVIEGNIVHSIVSPALAMQNGEGNAVIRNNLIFAGNSTCMTVNPYAHAGYAFAVPEFDIPAMLVENNTCWTSDRSYLTGGPSGSDFPGFYWVLAGNRTRSFKNTVVRNNIIFTHTFAAIWFGVRSQVEHFIFQNNIFYRADGKSGVISYGNTSMSDDFGSPFATTNTLYSLSDLATLNAANTGNSTANPKFVAESTSYVTTPEKFDFHVGASSPAKNAGATAGAPAVDIAGKGRDGSPDIGAYEYGASTSLASCTTAPSVSLTTPAAGATISGGSATLAATASAACGTISKISFAADSWSHNLDTPVCTASPCQVTFDSMRLSPGSRKFWALAVDSYGNSAASTQISATVSNKCTRPPTVRLPEPKAGYAINAGNYQSPNSLLWVNVDPSCGEVTDNQVFIDAIKLADSGNPTCFNGQEMSCEKFVCPNLYSSGKHTFRGYGQDAYGNQGFSAPVVFSVTNAPPSDISAPTGVAITAPSSGTVSGTIKVSASCVDNVACAGMLLLVDGTATSWKGSGPWEFSLNTAALASGMHTLTVLASDAVANSTTSAPVTVIIGLGGPR